MIGYTERQQETQRKELEEEVGCEKKHTVVHSLNQKLLDGVSKKERKVLPLNVTKYPRE